MADTFVLVSMTATNGELPQTISYAEDLYPIMDSSKASCYGSSERGPTLRAMLRTTLAYYKTEHLGYLITKSAKLNSSEVELASASICSLIEDIRKKPAQLISLHEQPDWSDDDIVDALDFAGDEFVISEWGGEDLPYMVKFLKSHLRVLETAKMHNEIVLHACSE